MVTQNKPYIPLTSNSADANNKDQERLILISDNNDVQQKVVITHKLI